MPNDRKEIRVYLSMNLQDEPTLGSKYNLGIKSWQLSIPPSQNGRYTCQNGNMYAYVRQFTTLLRSGAEFEQKDG